ncbi:hypothetical protein Bra3105_00235 [Brachybacterium halotolerans subsp. kimchii]|uniref:hypothetical protein n=1 Tax=Brachybacterium halotolerans TaxID=2795215 RepID=UPI001E2F9FEA|nr:hypothetical protein [Brachybacterium halotolerans]UEJ82799.1 hypothetical protein Bra3105_00235 [Brachybacterium halotolerans subsp. kimchii]
MAVAAVLVGWFDSWQSGNLLNPFGHPSISLWGYVAETPGLLGLRWAVALACLVAFTLIAFILTCSFAHLERREGRTNNGCFEVPWSPAELEKLPLIDGRRAPDVLFAAGRADMLGEATHRVERAEHEARVAWAAQELADAARRATPAPTLDDIINSVPSATRAGIYGKEQS